MWSKIFSTLSDAMNIYIPKFRLHSHQFPKWFSPELRHRLKCLRTLRRKYKRSPSNHNFECLRMAEEKFQQDVKDCKSKYETYLINSYASRHNFKLFQYINSMTKSKAIPSTIYYNATTASNNKDRATLFNQYFHSVFNQVNSDISEPDNLIPHPNPISHFEISEAEVYDALTQLDPTKAIGLDGIGPKILRSCALSLYQPLSHLFNISLSTGRIPYEWKIHKIVPVHKSANRSSVTNYRPISLLSNTSKILEQLIYNKVIKHICNDISLSQFGFMRGRSTLQQLLLYFDHIYNSVSSGCQVDAIYLDIRKAFDSVPHCELLLKLWKIGISGKLWNWFRCYLSNRLQCVTISNSHSDLLPVLSGVPQGSILGPMLFIIYINDMPLTCHFSKIFLFADDAKLCKGIPYVTDSTLLQHDLHNLQVWSLENHLQFNISKCVSLSINRKFNTTYTIDSQPLPQLDSHRDLGVLLSTDLTWSTHLDNISSKAYKILGFLRCTFMNCYNTDAKKQLYIMLVRSHLLYCSQLWNPCLIKDIINMERIQRRSTKYILNDYTSDYKTRLLKLKLLPLMYLLDLSDVLFFIKSIKLPSDNFNILHFVSFSSSNTRSSSHNKLNHHYSRTNKIRNSYFVRLPRLWNSLPPVDLNQSFSSIKTYIYNYLWKHFEANFNQFNPCTFHYSCTCSNCYQRNQTTNFVITSDSD